MQGFFKVGDGCDYNILPSNIKNGLSLEFGLYRKDLDTEGYTLNDSNQNKNKGIFFYIGTRAENKWVRYYGDACKKNDKHISVEETSNGVPLGEYISNLTESDNKYLIYSRTCGGTTVLNDKENPDTVLVETSPVEYTENLFTVFSRTCGGVTVNNYEDNYRIEEYNIYKDLWNNALAFEITDDNRIGYRYLVKNCDSDNPKCDYKIESEYSYSDNVPYAEWVTIHVRILPEGETGMRLMFYVDGRLVLFSKLLPILNLRELDDIYEKQEGVPFNISIGGGTQGLSDVVYEDYKNHQITNYPLQKEFGGSFIGYIKYFKLYSCSLNYNQINQNVEEKIKSENEPKIYCGAIVFNTKPSKTPINEQADIIPMLNEYSNDTKKMIIRLLPDITKKYLRLVVAIPSTQELKLIEAIDGMNGNSNNISGQDVVITNMFRMDTVLVNGTNYNVWYYTYATHAQYNNFIEINVG